MTTFRMFAAAMMLALAAPALADELGTPASKARFETMKAQLVSQLEANKFGQIKPGDKKAVLAALAHMQSRYDRVANADLLSQQDRVDLFNDQEIIVTITTHADADSRKVCERDATTGSRVPRISCMTLATRKERERTGQDSMRAVQQNSTNTFPGATTMKPGARQWPAENRVTVTARWTAIRDTDLEVLDAWTDTPVPSRGPSMGERFAA